MSTSSGVKRALTVDEVNKVVLPLRGDKRLFFEDVLDQLVDVRSRLSS